MDCGAEKKTGARGCTRRPWERAEDSGLEELAQEDKELLKKTARAQGKIRGISGGEIRDDRIFSFQAELMKYRRLELRAWELHG